ncbi:MAG: rhombotarget lipoprotein [Pseudomonadota bacterium]
MLKRTLLVVLVLPILSGCSSFWTMGNHESTREGASSSLVDFLYPKGEVPPELPDHLPQLSLPLRVGIAFVPSHGNTDITAAEKQELLEQVAGEFRDRPYVEAIEAIPDNYMRSARGITGMQQVAAMYGVDVMALVSYDQISFSAERDSALLYWTVVGALVVKGNSNEVQTMIDTAVFDVSTAKLLFRAPGTDADRSNATLMDTGKELRKLRSASFVAAADDMVVNLDQELTGFRQAVEAGERADVTWRGGGGSSGLLLIGMLSLAAVLATNARRQRAVRKECAGKPQAAAIQQRAN